MGHLKKIAILASGRGSNFSAIVRAIKNGQLQANLALLVCDNPKAAVMQKAKRAGVQCLLVKRKLFPSKEAFEQKIIDNLKEKNIDLIVLAGFMRMLSPYFVQQFKYRIVNIHPSLLPSFSGEHGIQDALDYGVKVTGVTVHFVDEEMDHGPVILQEAIKILEDDVPHTLEKKIHKVEHLLYPKAIQLYLKGKLKITGRKVVIKK